MYPPPGLDVGENPNLVCRLKKAIYGLKQAPREWFAKFSSAVEKAWFVKSHSDNTMFLKKATTGIAIFFVYVDDIVFTGDDLSSIDELKRHLKKTFYIKDLGDLKGFEVARSKKGVCLSQCKYAMDLLTRFGLLGCKPADFPMDQHFK